MATTETTKKGNKGVVIFVVIFIIIVILLVIFTAIPFPYSAQESYQDTEPSVEHYTETVPYTDQDCTGVDMIYKISWLGSGQTQTCLNTQCSSYNQVCDSYNWLGNCNSYSPRCASYECVKYNNHCAITVDNKESQGLNLQLQVQKYNRDTQTSEDVSGYSTNYYVSPLDTLTITWDFVSIPPNSVSCIYNVLNNPTKQVCQEVTKYRQQDEVRTIQNTVTRYRTVTKYCTLLNRMRGNCQ